MGSKALKIKRTQLGLIRRFCFLNIAERNAEEEEGSEGVFFILFCVPSTGFPSLPFTAFVQTCVHLTAGLSPTRGL